MQETRTIDHEEIRRWAIARGGEPAHVAGAPWELRFDWGEGDEALEPLSWEDFFDVFEEEGLAMAHIENDDSSVYEFVAREDSEVSDEYWAS